MGLIPSDAASIYGGQYRTVMLISSGYREHFGGPHVPDREFWKQSDGDEWRRVLRQARNPVVLGDRSVHVWDIRGWKNPEHDTTLRDHIGRHRDIMRSILGIADAEDAITEAITRVRRSLRGDCGDIALIGACAAARHRSVSWTTILAIIFEHYGVPYVLIHQGISGWQSLDCGGRRDCGRSALRTAPEDFDPSCAPTTLACVKGRHL